MMASDIGNAGGPSSPPGEDVIADQLQPIVTSSRLIAGALITGVLATVIGALAVIQGDVKGFEKSGVVTLIAGGFSLVAIVNHFLIPGLIIGTQVQKILADGGSSMTQIDQLGSLYRTQMIIALALLEGAAMFDVFALVMEKNVLMLAAALVLAGFMLFRFPTRTRIVWWVQEKLQTASFG